MKLKFIMDTIVERYINLFGNDIKKYIDEIWEILQLSYAPIGGFLTASSKEELISKTYMAKCVRKNGKIVAVCLYKDASGRKFVGGGTDGSPVGKAAFFQMLKEDIKMGMSWGEVSGKLEAAMVRLNAIPIPNKFAETLTGKQILKYNPDGYHYTRLIDGHEHEKIMFGVPKGIDMSKF